MFSYFQVLQGPLVGRIKEVEDGDLVYIYNKDHFNNDKHFLNESVDAKSVKVVKGNYLLTEIGDIIIDSNTYEAAVVKEGNEGLLLTFNYFLLKNNSQKMLDSYYFVCWFENSPNALRQLHDELQGSSVKKISRQFLNDLVFEYVDIDEQKRIGGLYKLYKKKHGLLKQQIMLEEEKIKHLFRGDDDGR